ncbi:hypothetical protein GCM10009430_40170 [Aquimarina litoralis]|uniref:Glycosyl transferase family 1 domain-containing protein n=1 Tax=Aquimarina litoralis TaxID=584605 RepID=A0ABN1J5X0_9FLAO
MNKSKRHIVFLTPGFASSEKDSTTIPALQIYLKSLRKELHDSKLTLLAFQFPFSSKSFIWNGIEVIPLNGKNKRWKKIYIWKKALYILKETHYNHPITIIHSFWIGECSYIGLKFSSKRNIKHITTVMGQDAYLGNRYVKNLIHSNSHIITLSKNQQNLLYKNHNLQSNVIPWFIDTSSFPDLQKSNIDILGVGSLNKIKNYQSFISIIRVLVQKRPNLKVEIIGEGAERTSIETQIKDLGLKNNISLLGSLSRKKVLHKMAEAKVLLHVSKYESFGLVFLEALYSGMLIVSRNVGIAETNNSWSICNTNNEVIVACDVFLNHSHKQKERKLLYSETDTITSYIKLYNE